MERALGRKELPESLSKWSMISKDFIKYKYVYVMLVPVVLFYLIFSYWPMYGALVAFKDYRPGIGIWSAHWVGFKYFADFFSGPFFKRIVLNTIILNLYSLVIVFPFPILLALSFNELRGRFSKKMYQTFTYLPYFVSTMIICGIITDFVSTHGVIMYLARALGYSGNVSLLMDADYFRPIYICSEIWQTAGWSSILYISALSSINPELYEAAKIDGAGRWRQMFNVTLPGISPTIMIMLILTIGSIMSVGFEKVFLLYQPVTYPKSDVISTYVYRKGMNDMAFGYSTAVGLFNSVVNMCLLIVSNNLSRRFTNSSLF